MRHWLLLAMLLPAMATAREIRAADPEATASADAIDLAPVIEGHPCAGKDKAYAIRIGTSTPRFAEPICVASGKPTLTTAVDGSHRRYAVLAYAKQRGDRIDDMLKVQRIEQGASFTVFETSMSCQTLGARHTFRIETNATKTNGLAVTLKGDSGSPSAGPGPAPQEASCNEGKEIWLDPTPAKTAIRRKHRVNADDWQVAAFPQALFGEQPDGAPRCDHGTPIASVDDKNRPIAWLMCVPFADAKARSFVDAAGRRYLLIEFEGIGTWPQRGQTLEIYAVDDTRVRKIIEIPLAQAVTFETAFVSRYRFGGLHTNGLEIILDGELERDIGAACCGPGERQHVIWIDPK